MPFAADKKSPAVLFAVLDHRRHGKSRRLKKIEAKERTQDLRKRQGDTLLPQLTQVKERTSGPKIIGRGASKQVLRYVCSRSLGSLLCIPPRMWSWIFAISNCGPDLL